MLVGRTSPVEDLPTQDHRTAWKEAAFKLVGHAPAVVRADHPLAEHSVLAMFEIPVISPALQWPTSKKKLDSHQANTDMTIGHCTYGKKNSVVISMPSVEMSIEGMTAIYMR